MIAGLLFLACCWSCSSGLSSSSGDSTVADGPVTFDAVSVDASAAVDAVPDVPAQSACEQARNAWLARVATVDHTCTDPSDCGLIGEENPLSCNGPPHIAAACEGEAARMTALDDARAELENLETAWAQACANVSCGSPGKPCTSDCGPGIAACVEGHCVSRPAPCPNNCLCVVEPDAGI